MSTLAEVAGHQKVAAFLLSLEPETAKGILRHLEGEVLQRVARAMVELDPRLSEAGTVDELYRELARSAHGPKRVSGVDRGGLTAILANTFGQAEADSIVATMEARRRTDRPFLDVESHPPATIAKGLESESLAVAAMVLGHLEPKDAAAVLSFWDEERTLEVVRRIATLGTPPGAVLSMVAEKLGQRLAGMSGESGGVDADVRLQSVAEILSNSAPTLEAKVIETISEDNAEMANELREFMFTWDDIATIDKRSMQKILGAVDTKTLSMALKACPPAVEDNLMGNLSARVKDMVLEERELAGAVPMDTVREAREEIMRSIRAMIEAGEFSPTRAGEDLVT